MTAGTKENTIAYAWSIFNIYYLPGEVEKKYMHYPGICCSPLIISALPPKKCSGYTGICHSCLLCWLVPLKQKLSHCTHAQQDKKCGPHMTDRLPCRQILRPASRKCPTTSTPWWWLSLASPELDYCKCTCPTSNLEMTVAVWCLQQNPPRMVDWKHTLKKIRTPNVDNPQEIMFPIVNDLALGFAQECREIRPHNAVPK